MFEFVSSKVLLTAACTPNLNHCSKLCNKSMVHMVLGGFSFMQLMHTFWSTKQALGVYFKETWVRVNPNDLMPFM